MARQRRAALYSGKDRELRLANDKLHWRENIEKRICKRIQRIELHSNACNSTMFPALVAEDVLDTSEQPADGLTRKIDEHTNHTLDTQKPFGKRRKYNTRAQTRKHNSSNNMTSTSTIKDGSKKLGPKLHRMSRRFWLEGWKKPKIQQHAMADEERELFFQYLEEIERLSKTHRDLTHRLNMLLVKHRLVSGDQIRAEWVFKHWGNTYEMKKELSQETVLARGVWKLIAEKSDGSRFTVLEFLDEWPRHAWGDPIGWTVVPVKKTGNDLVDTGAQAEYKPRS